MGQPKASQEKHCGQVLLDNGVEHRRLGIVWKVVGTDVQHRTGGLESARAYAEDTDSVLGAWTES